MRFRAVAGLFCLLLWAIFTRSPASGAPVTLVDPCDGMFEQPVTLDNMVAKPGKPVAGLSEQGYYLFSNLKQDRGSITYQIENVRSMELSGYAPFGTFASLDAEGNPFRGLSSADSPRRLLWSEGGTAYLRDSRLRLFEMMIGTDDSYQFVPLDQHPGTELFWGVNMFASKDGTHFQPVMHGFSVERVRTVYREMYNCEIPFGTKYIRVVIVRGTPLRTQSGSASNHYERPLMLSTVKFYLWDPKPQPTPSPKPPPKPSPLPPINTPTPSATPSIPPSTCPTPTPFPTKTPLPPFPTPTPTTPPPPFPTPTPTTPPPPFPTPTGPSTDPESSDPGNNDFVLLPGSPSQGFGTSEGAASSKASSAARPSRSQKSSTSSEATSSKKSSSQSSESTANAGGTRSPSIERNSSSSSVQTDRKKEKSSQLSQNSLMGLRKETSGSMEGYENQQQFTKLYLTFLLSLLGFSLGALYFRRK